jgi:3-oxoacyl-(acyl-carrier-protein) synthase
MHPQPPSTPPYRAGFRNLALLLVAVAVASASEPSGNQPLWLRSPAVSPDGTVSDEEELVPEQLAEDLGLDRASIEANATLERNVAAAVASFDAARDGLALGEGAAVLALESFGSAQARGAVILAEVAGYGAATDRHHLTQPHPAGDAALATMTAACQQAGIGPADVGYLNAHGTGTPLNDSAEAAAITRWAGGSAAQVPVSSTKGCVGHLLGAAGAVEAAVCTMALLGGWLPPGRGVASPDPACRFPILAGPQDLLVEYMLSNSFGFGGANASLVLRRSP